MNTERAQELITSIVTTYRASAYKGGRKQYPASQKYIKQAEELGILSMIPNGYGMKTPGNTEIQLILDAATDAGKDVGGMVDGEGDVTTTAPHPLYVAINEQPEPELVSFTEEIEHETETEVAEVTASWGTGNGVNVFHLNDAQTTAILYEFVFPSGTGRAPDAAAAAQVRLQQYAATNGYRVVRAWWMPRG